MDEVRSRRCWGHLFGLPWFVIAFNRWSCFLQQLTTRRTLFGLPCLYFSIQDGGLPEHSARQSPTKNTSDLAEADFLGLQCRSPR